MCLCDQPAVEEVVPAVRSPSSQAFEPFQTDLGANSTTQYNHVAAQVAHRSTADAGQVRIQVLENDSVLNLLEFFGNSMVKVQDVIRILSVALILATTGSGCLLDTRFVQMPQLMPRHPATEHRAAEYHDPYPDESIGPSTGSRPLGFKRQRAEARRAADLRGVHLLDPGDLLPPTSAAPDTNRFSEVVDP